MKKRRCRPIFPEPLPWFTMRRRRHTDCLAITPTSSSLLLLYTSATKAHSLLIKSSVKGRPGPWQAHCESWRAGRGLCVCVASGKEERDQRGAERSWQDPRPSAMEGGGRALQNGGTALPISVQRREGGKKGSTVSSAAGSSGWASLNLKDSWVWFWFYTSLIPGS